MLHPLPLELTVLGAFHPVPAWSHRALSAGEWREREGAGTVLPPARRRRLGAASRKRELAEAAGTLEYLAEAAPGRMGIGRRRRESPARCEEGRDDTGVT